MSLPLWDIQTTQLLHRDIVNRNSHFKTELEYFQTNLRNQPFQYKQYKCYYGTDYKSRK
ncbi:hypothetical protein J6590_085866 [Homalodisca vitripennis]|nr:hypothetical protein J6590_085866 [Homalodisca vitripennis]